VATLDERMVVLGEAPDLGEKRQILDLDRRELLGRDARPVVELVVVEGGGRRRIGLGRVTAPCGQEQEKGHQGTEWPDRHHALHGHLL
jgi:hypothetical protein